MLTKPLFRISEILSNLYFTRIFHFFLTQNSIGVIFLNTSKPLLNYSILPFNFLLSGPDKSTVLNVWNVEFATFNEFWISSLYAIGKPKSSIFWKTSERGAKRNEMWTSEWIFSVHRVPLTLKCLMVIPVHFGAFPIFDKIVARKWFVEWNGVKFAPRGEYSPHTGYFWQLSTLDHFEVFRCISDFRQPCILKTTGRSAKRRPKPLCYPFLCAHCLPCCQADRKNPLGILLNMLKTEVSVLI